MIEQALVFGETVVIENLPEKVDPVLEPLLSRKTIKRGRLVLKHEQYTFKHFFSLQRSLKKTPTTALLRSIGVVARQIML